MESDFVGSSHATTEQIQVSNDENANAHFKSNTSDDTVLVKEELLDASACVFQGTSRKIIPHMHTNEMSQSAEKPFATNPAQVLPTGSIPNQSIVNPSLQTRRDMFQPGNTAQHSSNGLVQHGGSPFNISILPPISSIPSSNISQGQGSLGSSSITGYGDSQVPSYARKSMNRFNNIQMRYSFTPEQKMLLHQHFESGMTGQSLAFQGKIMECALEAGVEFDVVRNWIGNMRRKERMVAAQQAYMENRASTMAGNPTLIPSSIPGMPGIPGMPPPQKIARMDILPPQPISMLHRPSPATYPSQPGVVPPAPQIRPVGMVPLHSLSVVSGSSLAEKPPGPAQPGWLGEGSPNAMMNDGRNGHPPSLPPGHPPGHPPIMSTTDQKQMHVQAVIEAIKSHMQILQTMGCECVMAAVTPFENKALIDNRTLITGTTKGVQYFAQIQKIQPFAEFVKAEAMFGSDDDDLSIGNESLSDDFDDVSVTMQQQHQQQQQQQQQKPDTVEESGNGQAATEVNESSNKCEEEKKATDSTVEVKITNSQVIQAGEEVLIVSKDHHIIEGMAEVLCVATETDCDDSNGSVIGYDDWTRMPLDDCYYQPNNNDYNQYTDEDDNSCLFSDDNDVTLAPELCGEVENPGDELHTWSDVPQDPPDFPFNQIPGLAVKLEDISPAEIFDLLITRQMIDLMVTETNRHAAAEINKCRPLLKDSRLNAWKETNAVEMRKFLALLLHMGPNSKPSLEHYWSTNVLYQNTLFPGIMSRNRFQMILRFWHFVDNSQPHDDPLYKVRPLLNHFNDTMSRIYHPRKQLCIGEFMVLHNDRLLFRQYVKDKKDRHGIKLFELCESQGMVLKVCMTHSTDALVADDTGVRTSGAVVLELMRNHLDKGHALYTNNYYNSVGLVKYLTERSTYLCGLLRFDCTENPKNVMQRKLRKGEHVWNRSDSVVVCKWRPKHEILAISNMHRVHMVNVTNRNNKISAKPNVIGDCNGMFGLDRSDQMFSYYSGLRKTEQWYKTIALYIMETCILNAHVLYNEVSVEQLKRWKFRDCITAHLLGDSLMDLQARPAVPVKVDPDNTFHHLQTIPPTEKKDKPCRQCRVCAKSKRRRETRYACFVCPENPALCVENCFKEYHCTQ